MTRLIVNVALVLFVLGVGAVARKAVPAALYVIGESVEHFTPPGDEE